MIKALEVTTQRALSSFAGFSLCAAPGCCARSLQITVVVALPFIASLADVVALDAGSLLMLGRLNELLWRLQLNAGMKAMAGGAKVMVTSLPVSLCHTAQVYLIALVRSSPQCSFCRD